MSGRCQLAEPIDTPSDQLHRRGRCPRGATLNGDTHECTRQRNIEQLFPVPRPQRARTAVDRHLPPSDICVGVRLYPNFEATGVICSVREPATVRRDHTVPLDERCLNKRSDQLPAAQFDSHDIFRRGLTCFRDDHMPTIWRRSSRALQVQCPEMRERLAGVISLSSSVTTLVC